MESESGVMHFKDGGRGHSQGMLESGKAKKRFSPEPSRM